MGKSRIAAALVDRLPYSFYENNTLDMTAALLGKYLVRQDGKRVWIGRIVETEAYIGEDDAACHASRGRTPRTKIMYGPPGYAYVYFTYGMHFMLNVVSARENLPAAILIRALEPLSGFASEDPRPASGPGKLCKSMRIDKSLNGISLQSSELWIGTGSDSVPLEIRWSPRIGINVATDRIWRAYVYGNPFVSRRSNPLDPAIPWPQGDF